MKQDHFDPTLFMNVPETMQVVEDPIMLLDSFLEFDQVGWLDDTHLTSASRKIPASQVRQIVTRGLKYA
jgi:hypothetical protein